MSPGSGDPVRLVLHPGHPKCGSSSIQHALLVNRARLLERGVYYPSRRPNQVFIDACDRQEWGPVQEWLTSLLDRAREAGCETLVVSSENLGVRQLVEPGRPMHELFARHCHPVDVVYYLRRQDDWMVSMWQQWGHKRGQSVGEFVDDRLYYDEPVYPQAIRLFENVYGADHVEAVPLHRSALLDGNLIADFARRSGIGRLPVEDPERFRNPSMSGFLCDVLARVPEVYEHWDVAQVAKGETDYSIRRLLERHVSPRVLFSRDKRVMPLELRRRVMEHFAEDNRTLHARHFPDVPFDEVFGLPAPGEDEELRELRARVDGLQDVVAMQMQVIVELLEAREEPGPVGRVRELAGRLRRKLGRIRSRISGAD